MRVQRNKNTGEHRVDFGDGTWVPARVQRNNSTGEMRVLANGQTYPYEGQLSWSEVPGKALENFVPSAKRAVGDIVEAVSSPWETAKSLGNVALGTAQKLIPGEQESEKYADAVGQYFAGRYGSMDGFKNALAHDPVGVLSDLSTAFTGGAGALKGGAKVAQVAGKAGAAANIGRAGDLAMTAAHALDPLTMTAKAVTAPFGAAGKGYDFLKQTITGAPREIKRPLAERLYQRSLKPLTSLDPQERTAMIQTALRERISPTEGGYQRLVDRQSELGREIRRFIDERTQLEATGAVPRTIDPEAIAHSAMEYASNRLHISSEANVALPQARSAVSNFLESHGFQNMDTATAQAVKQRTQLEAQKAFGETMATPAQEAKKGLAHALRTGIEQNIPEVAPLNARYAELAELRPLIERALGREGNVNAISLPSIVAGVGAAGSGASPAAKAALGLATTTAANTARLPGVRANLAFMLDAANSGLAQAMNKVLSDIRLPATAAAYAGGRTKETYREMLNRHGVKTSLDK